MNRIDMEHLADHITELLEDDEVILSISTRHRYEGALTVLEAVLGRPSSLVEFNLDSLL